MELNTYQAEAMRTAIYPIDRGMDYAISNLAGEVGELASHWAKAIRDFDGHISPERRESMILEGGDILWMMAAVARELDTTLGNMAVKNLEKLASRAQRGKLQGSGDNR